MSQRVIADSDAVLTQGGNGAFQIHGIPECDGRDVLGVNDTQIVSVEIVEAARDSLVIGQA